MPHFLLHLLSLREVLTCRREVLGLCSKLCPYWTTNRPDASHPKERDEGQHAKVLVVKCFHRLIQHAMSAVPDHLTGAARRYKGEGISGGDLLRKSSTSEMTGAEDSEFPVKCHHTGDFSFSLSPLSLSASVFLSPSMIFTKNEVCFTYKIHFYFVSFSP